jgi:hypothetical protein
VSKEKNWSYRLCIIEENFNRGFLCFGDMQQHYLSVQSKVEKMADGAEIAFEQIVYIYKSSSG